MVVHNGTATTATLCYILWIAHPTIREQHVNRPLLLLLMKSRVYQRRDGVASPRLCDRGTERERLSGRVYEQGRVKEIRTANSNGTQHPETNIHQTYANNKACNLFIYIHIHGIKSTKLFLDPTNNHFSNLITCPWLLVFCSCLLLHHFALYTPLLLLLLL